jgi:CRISPR-associated protein Csd2
MSTEIINNRYEFVYLFDVENGNPNGDPDAGNMPRIDPETNHGIVTDVCLKRKVRNYVQLKHSDKSPYRIYVKEMAVLNRFHQEGYDHFKIPKTKMPKAGSQKGKEVELVRDWMCDNFFDVRAFGAVMATEVPAGVVRGPIQFSFARSIEPVVPLEITITRVAVTKEGDAEKKEHEMGRKHIIPYGLYRVEGFISSNFAFRDATKGNKDDTKRKIQGTGFSEDDLDLFWEALENMFEYDHSAARGKMSARKLFVFKHESNLGNAPAHKLFELITEKRANDASKPPRAFSDYTIECNKAGVPRGVTLEEKI